MKALHSSAGPAFPPLVKLLATVMVVVLLAQGAQVLRPMLQQDWTAAGAAFIAGALVLVGWTLAWIWRSRTGVDGEGIRQTWFWSKSVRWEDVVQARLVVVPGMEWLVAPRLIVRRRTGGVLVFHVGSAAVRAQLAKVLLGDGMNPLGAR
jgi:hypothetical protein